jgi:hypothetical protein
VKLLELQRRMAADLMRPLTRRDNLSPKSKAGEYITPNDRLTSYERLQIYSRSYWYRILDSLYDDFPGLRAIVGDDAFHKLSRAYLAAHPSQSFTMRNLGHALEPWLRPRRQYTGGRHAMALDMVRLEWAHIEAFDGPSAKPLGPEDLLELGPGLRMSLHPYISLLELHYPVDDLRISISRKQDLHGTASNAVTEHKHRATKRRTLARSKAPILVAVHRYTDMVYYRRLEPEAYRILVSLRRGDSIGTAIENGFAGSALSADDYQAGIAKWFAVWAELGWLCRPSS